MTEVTDNADKTTGKTAAPSKTTPSNPPAAESESPKNLKKGGAEEAPLPGELDDCQKREALEAILFAAGYAVPYEKLAPLLGLSPGKMKRFAEATAKVYNETPGRGILLLTMDDRCQLCTKAAYKAYIREALGIRLSGRLSSSSLEVLAVIAYHQPVTKSYIEQIRGVDCSYALGSLCDKQLVEPKGRLEAPGRPLLYGTTDGFLRCFGLSSLEDLPERPEEGAAPAGEGSNSPLRMDAQTAGKEAPEASPMPNQLSFLPEEELLPSPRS